MELMTPAQRDELLATVERDAFHLELRDHYLAASEDDAIQRWRNNEPEDYLWHEPWLRRIRTAVASGKTIRRLRVVTEPLSEYSRWLHSASWPSLEAGEDIRWLPRHRLPARLQLPVDGNDFWVFDNRLVTVGHFDSEGRILGSELVTDQNTVTACTRVRDQLWPLATPHREYQPT